LLVLALALKLGVIGGIQIEAGEQMGERLAKLK